MGILYYGDARTPVSIDDRALAHLKVVIMGKLRRGEAFGFSWQKGVSEGGGRSTIWLHPAIPIQFDFDGSRVPKLNRDWLEVLSRLSSTPNGLSIVEEPAEQSSAEE